jgi:hypothetical protein
MRSSFKNVINPLMGVVVFVLCFCTTIKVNAADRYYYQIKVYHLKNTKQVAMVESFLQNAYLPALHKLGIKNIGVFKPITEADTTDRKIYVFTPYKNMDELESTPAKLLKDQQYLANGKDYLDAPVANLPYVRIETILLRAFGVAPTVELPKLTANKTDRFYELRSYESGTEKIHANKVEMFDHEVAIFNKINANGVFYAQVIAGSRMPNLMYLTTYNSQQDRDDHWKAFFAHPDWKELSGKAEYKGNVQKNEQTFLHPTSYSDF